MKNIKNAAINVPRNDNEKNNENIILSVFLLENNALIKVIIMQSMTSKIPPKKFDAVSSGYAIKDT